MAYPTQIQMQLEQIGIIVLDAVAATPDGAPSGVIYAALVGRFANLGQYQSFMGTLVSKGMLEQQGDLYLMTKPGSTFLARLRCKHGLPVATTAH